MWVWVSVGFRVAGSVPINGRRSCLFFNFRRRVYGLRVLGSRHGVGVFGCGRVFAGQTDG